MYEGPLHTLSRISRELFGCHFAAAAKSKKKIIDHLQSNALLKSVMSLER